MRGRHIPMSFEAFPRLPAHPGWKREYWDGAAHISPRARLAEEEGRRLQEMDTRKRVER